MESRKRDILERYSDKWDTVKNEQNNPASDRKKITLSKMCFYASAAVNMAEILPIRLSNQSFNQFYASKQTENKKGTTKKIYS